VARTWSSYAVRDITRSRPSKVSPAGKMTDLARSWPSVFRRSSSAVAARIVKTPHAGYFAKRPSS
jgi:hypothetical protein